MSDTEFLLYTKPNCSFCMKAKALLTQKGLTYQELTLEHPEILLEFKAILPEAKTVPQIFHNGNLIGGYDQLVIYFDNLASDDLF